MVPEERTQELFHELSFHPSQKQSEFVKGHYPKAVYFMVFAIFSVSEMLQTAKKVARKGGSSQENGLTFGQFCVLAADLKRFR